MTTFHIFRQGTRNFAVRYTHSTKGLPDDFCEPWKHSHEVADPAPWLLEEAAPVIDKLGYYIFENPVTVTRVGAHAAR